MCVHVCGLFAFRLPVRLSVYVSVPVNRDDLLNVDNKNWNGIVCRRCDSLIFPEDKVGYIENYTAELPVMTVGGREGKETETISWWWHTKSDKDFDTIGFEWLVIDNKKVTLLCGDCEFGPIGLRSLDDKEFWVAVERVRYKDKNPVIFTKSNQFQFLEKP
ncbi:unnamed protein product [Angiostrongylus costaricensis]|uniref:Mss4-like protein n=1 Tax=Angiostrongylus costaricensis TaxID=334426 RepID=A0A0R3PFA5_ANGCS|nr:unnamed protein product [Angiostrongylus costaricensis]